jgi:hypothetical protein
MSENIFEQEIDRASEANNYSEESFTPEMSEQIRQIEALAQMDESFANSAEYKDLMASLSTSSQANEEEEEEEEEEDSESEDEEEDDVEDIFGILSTPKKAKEVKLNFEPQKEMINFINSHYGVNDASKFFASVDTWRNQAQEGADVKRDFEALSSDLQAMPQDIRMAVQLWAAGDDYSKAFSSNERLDFSGDFRDQEIENLVQHYLPDEYDELYEAFKDDKIDEEELEDRIKLLARTTKRMFSEDKQAIEADREQFIQKQNSEFQNMKKSALLSVENLGKAYPDFSKSEISKIRSILVEGKLDNLFMKQDGAYNEDAAELVAYAMYGKKMLETVKKSAKRKGESEANQKIVDSSPKALRKNKSAGTTQGMNTQAVGHLSGLFKGDPYS